MKLSHQSPLVLAVVLTLVALTLMAATPISVRADTPTPTKVFLPLILRDISTSTSALVDPVWRWGDVSIVPGETGIHVVDLDSDGKHETLISSAEMLVAMRHLGQYRFGQSWAVPIGPSWGIADIAGLGTDQIWVLGWDSRLLAYKPYEYTPVVDKQLDFGRDSARMAITANLLGDTRPELIVWVADAIYALDLPTLETVWSFRIGPDTVLDERNSIVVAQLDDDPSMEVAISTGHVIDQAQGVEQWCLPAGFGKDMRAGDVDDDGRDELVAVSSWFVATAYDVDRRAALWQITANAGIERSGLADVAGDATPELLVGMNVGASNVAAYDTLSQSRLWTVIGFTDGVHGLGVGDANDDGETDLVWGGSGSIAVDFAPVGARQAAFSYPSSDGPYKTAALQMDGDAALEIVVFTRSMYNPYSPLPYFILDSATGQEEPGLRLDVEIPLFHESITWKPFMANIDGDSFDELILQSDLRLYALDNDATRLAERTFVEQHIPDWVGDADGDGQLELVAHTSNRVRVLGLNDLADEWQTSAFTAGVNDVAVGDVDADGHMEAVFHGSASYLQAYDLVTHTFDWQMPATQRTSAVAISDADGAGGLEIATLEQGRICFYNAQTRVPLGCAGQVRWDEYADYDLRFSRLSSADYPQLVVIQSGAVQIFKHPFDLVPFQTIPSESPTSVVFADTDNDQHPDLLAGSLVSVTRFRSRAGVYGVPASSAR